MWWVDAEQPELMLEKIASLPSGALVSGDTTIPLAAEAARRHLRGTDRWLLVFDNAEDPAAIRQHLPGGPGHVLITSRNRSWTGVATPVEIDVFTRAESVHLLTHQATTLTGQDADTIADRLGDLPLAIAQAAWPASRDEHECLLSSPNALREETEHVLSEGVPATYRASLPAVVRVATKNVASVDPAAVQLLNVCAFLAPEPVDTAWFASVGQGDLPESLAKVASRSIELRQCLALLARHGLAQATTEGALLHRLTAAITCQTLAPDEQAAARAAAEQLLVAAAPVTEAPSTWTAWAAILPHLIHIDPATTTNGDLREVACNATLIPYLRGDYPTGGDSAQQPPSMERQPRGKPPLHAPRRQQHRPLPVQPGRLPRRTHLGPRYPRPPTPDPRRRPPRHAPLSQQPRTAPAGHG